ncbi:MAG: hypothetical protein PUA99_08870 [Roseburia hominis]|nr:hypothetical protein [Roseburia hominis]
MDKKDKWMVTVAKSGVLEVEADTEQEAYELIENLSLTKLIQWEDSWNVVDIDKLTSVE